MENPEQLLLIMHPRIATKWEELSLKRIYFISIITIVRKKDESRDEGATKTDATKDDDHDTVVEVEENRGLDGSKPKIIEGESRDTKRNDLYDRACGETKEVKKVEKEKEKSDEEVEEELKEEEEDDNPKYFNTFPTIKELSYHEWILKNP
nr:hypothetical protein [Tanacetum cinerariifolium]